MTMAQAEIEIEIPFYDVDSARIVWHGHYAKYFERARCRLLEDIGHGYDAMFACGIIWPIVDMRVRYMRPLRFNQQVSVIATLKHWTHQLKITYRVRDSLSGASLARGHTLQAPVDMATGELLFSRPAAVTDALTRAGIAPGDT